MQVAEDFVKYANRQAIQIELAKMTSFVDADHCLITPRQAMLKSGE